MLEDLRGKTFLVTGATGFLGSHLADRLRQIPDSRLILLSRGPGPARRSDRETWVTASLPELDTATWHDAGLEVVDVVFHLGAFTPKSPSEADDRARVYDDNLIGTRALIESLPAPPGVFLLASTLDVYAPPGEGVVLSEDSPLGPTSLYGASKLFCERLVAGWARGAGCRHAVLRYGHVYGPGEASYRKLIPETIRQLLRGEPPVLYGDGSALRDYLYVGDAVEATLRAAATDLSGVGPVNIVRGESRSIRDVVTILAGITHFGGEVEYREGSPAGLSLRFDAGRMRASLGDWPFVPLERGLELEVDCMRGLPSRS